MYTTTCPITLSRPVRSCALNVCRLGAPRTLPDTVLVSPDRHVPLEGQSNFRGLGGYHTVDGRTDVNLLTDDDREIYGEDRLPEGAASVLLPIDSDVATELANEANAALRSGDFTAILSVGLWCFIARTVCIAPGPGRRSC